MSAVIPLRIGVLGTGNVGKSALTLQFVYEEFVEDYEPTKCSAYKRFLNVEGFAVDVDITDTAGQEDYVGINDQHYRSNEGFLVVFSLTDMDSLRAVPQILDRIVQLRTVEQTPVVVVGNKSDLTAEREVDSESVRHIIQEFKVPYMETSAKTQYNVQNAFFLLIRELVRLKLNARQQPEQVHSSGSGCCGLL